MACISRKTVTHLISHNQKLDPRDHSSRETFFPPKLTMAPMMAKVEFSLVWVMWRLSSPLWIALVPDNEDGGSLTPVLEPKFHFLSFFISFCLFLGGRKSHVNCTLIISFLSGRKTDANLHERIYRLCLGYCWRSRFLSKSAASFLLCFDLTVNITASKM